jgi:putative ABC transport system ATP-binding protein
VGASGAGKSTLLRLACRLAEPTEGSIRLNGVDICGLPVLKLRVQVSMVFQLPTMLPGTVQDNILYGPRLAMNDAGVGRASAGTDTPHLPDARALLDQVGLAPDLLGRPAADLSVGQQQRVCIARSLANQPEVLLLDEPTSALDPASARGILQLVQDLNRERNLTVLKVTHILDHARLVAHDAAVMDKGKVVSAGPASILDDSASLMADKDPVK